MHVHGLSFAFATAVRDTARTLTSRKQARKARFLRNRVAVAGMPVDRDLARHLPVAKRILADAQILSRIFDLQMIVKLWHLFPPARTGDSGRTDTRRLPKSPRVVKYPRPRNHLSSYMALRAMASSVGASVIDSVRSELADLETERTGLYDELGRLEQEEKEGGTVTRA